MNDDQTIEACDVIGVVICTAKRIQMLERCILSILDQKNLPGGFRHEIVIVDNADDESARAIVEKLAGDALIPLHYVSEKRRGIPFARNCTIQEALSRDYDWMALIDDDEVARPDWLEKLINGALTHHADVANGPVIRHYEGELPDWWHPLKTPDVPTGHLLDEAPTNNTLFTTRLVKKDGLNLRFDNRLTFGYEDIDFFRRAHAAKANIIWVHDAVVEEEIPASRMTNRRLLQRVEMQAAGVAFANKIRRGNMKAWLRYGLKGSRRIVSGVLMLMLAPFVLVVKPAQGRRFFFRSLARVLKGWGHLRGLLHLQPDYYAQIDGN